MDTVQDIERAITALTPHQREQLALWFEEHYPPQLIDTQLEADLHSGQMDARLARAAAHYEAGETELL